MINWNAKDYFDHLAELWKAQIEEYNSWAIPLMASSSGQALTSANPNRTVWIYPDGTTSTTKPQDGAIQAVLDQSSQTFRYFKWDENRGQWLDVTYQAQASANNPGYGVYINGKKIETVEEISITVDYKKNKCECGSEAAGSNKHSQWCVKWISET